MYKTEKLNNFRFLYTLLASKSSYLLQTGGVASKEVHREIELIGEFADVSYSPIALERVFGRMDLLSQKHFPLEGYEAVTSSKLVHPFEGEIANVKGLVAYRPTTKQLVVGICGTHTLMQVLYDMNSLFHRCTKGGQSYRMHSGFMSMYTGLEALAFKGIRKGLEEEEVDELIVRFPHLEIGCLDLTRKMLAHGPFYGSGSFVLPRGGAVDGQWNAPSGDTNQDCGLWFTPSWRSGVLFLLEETGRGLPIQSRSGLVPGIQHPCLQ